MINPLLENLQLPEQWLSFNTLCNVMVTLLCLGFVLYSAIYRPERFKRICFLIATLSLALYQLPFMTYSPLFYKNLPDATLFAISIHAAVAINLLWVFVTPGLNAQKNNFSLLNNRICFEGFAFWFPCCVFVALLGLYFNKIPFTCSALYSLFADQEIALLVREIIGKLMGRTYAPHLLNTLTSAIGPIVCFLTLGKVYYAYLEGKWIHIAGLLLLLLLVMGTPLLGGAKGSLIPGAVALSVSGFLVVNNWRWRILLVPLILALFSFMILVVKVAQESKVGVGTYPFGSCIVKLGVCDRTHVLLESLKLSKSYYGLSKTRIDSLNAAATSACNPGTVMPKKTSILSKEMNSIHGPEKDVMTHINGLIYRVLVTPVQVASWHFIYVSDFGRPGFSAMPIAKFLSKNYVNVPAKVCETYYSGDKTSSCTAPTSYLFTYPAYFGVIGLLFASLATILFDTLVTLLMKYTLEVFSNLTVGTMSVAAVNFIVADYTTVLISHGAAAALVVLFIITFYCRMKIPNLPKEQNLHVVH